MGTLQKNSKNLTQVKIKTIVLGTGLGLFMSYDFIKHKEESSVCSRRKVKGAEFTILLFL